MADDLLEILMIDQERAERDEEPVPYELQEALMVMLLVICPNVEILRVEDVQVRFLKEFLKMNSEGQRYLRSLRHVELLRDKSDEEFSVDRYLRCHLTDNLLDLMSVPSIERVTTRGVFEDGIFPPFLRSGVSNIKKLDIRYSTVENRVFRFIIHHPKELEEFKFSSGQLEVSPDDYGYEYLPRFFGRSLLRHRSALKVLDLDVDNAVTIDSGADYDSDNFCDWSKNSEDEDDEEDSGDGWEFDMRRYGHTIGSLHDFIALRRLSIGVCVLFGPLDEDDDEFVPVPFRLIDALPPNLEHLCIRGCVAGEYTSHTKQIGDFLVNKHRWPPSLKEICGLAECEPGLPFWNRLDEDERMDDVDALVPWEQGQDKWTDYGDEEPPKLQDVPWVRWY
ncbi:hypothetical protein AJ79_01887 [Helicocarpus griseus UAMH5409]|uniref:Leucine-rich repeat domain-containing protein n=1 Tax=Helicocarpus griseus UAMH5409 TaxID=1447875 RepID=A0A2B7Y569_9EURO|nr:hypothetical protein AJ79_01887 [Helicocarpus griseus UAMH5409]